MGAASELLTTRGLSKQSWLFDPVEQDRFRTLCLEWKKANANATVEKQILIEGLVRCHIWEQRLIDRRRFFNGEPTDYRVQDGRKTADLTDEHQARKDREWLAYMPLIQRWKLDHLKLALANSIDVQVVNDLSSLFTALDASDRKALTAYRGCNGEA